MADWIKRAEGASKSAVNDPKAPLQDAGMEERRQAVLAQLRENQNIARATLIDELADPRPQVKGRRLGDCRAGGQAHHPSDGGRAHRAPRRARKGVRMRVTARFNGHGLELELHAETEPEKKMIGAVLNQPFSDPEFRQHQVNSTLVNATVHYDGHWSNKSVDRLTLEVHRQEKPVHDGAGWLSPNHPGNQERN
jgi:hypothetical protein